MFAVYQCKRCNHKWSSRRKDKPIVCPKCKSPYWDKDRQVKPEIEK